MDRIEKAGQVQASDIDMLCIIFTKYHFDDPSYIWSMPTDLFERCRFITGGGVDDGGLAIEVAMGRAHFLRSHRRRRAARVQPFSDGSHPYFCQNRDGTT